MLLVEACLHVIDRFFRFIIKLDSGLWMIGRNLGTDWAHARTARSQLVKSESVRNAIAAA